MGSTTAISDANGEVLFRFVYDTYGELSDITTDEGISLKTSEKLTEYRLAELAHVIGINYLYNGQYGVETDTNGLYYMRARYYNQDIKRFINRDVVSGDITNSQSLNRYCYVQGNPVSLIDPFGLCPTEEERKSIKFKRALSNIVHTTLDAVGLLVPGMGDMLDAVNAIIYAIEGEPDMAIISFLCTIPIVGSLIGLPIKYAMKYGVDVGMAFMKFGIRNAPEITEGVSRLARAMKSKYDDASAWVSKKFAKFTPDGDDFNNRTYTNVLKYNEDGTWTSNEGLIYGQGSKDGNRVKHILQHTQPNPSKPLHTVFNVDKSNVIGLIDEAWAHRGKGILQENGNVLYDINMGRTIGTNGENTIRIITKGYSNNIITAFPVGKEVN